MKKLMIIILLVITATGCKQTESITMIVPFGSTELAQLYLAEDPFYQVDIVHGPDPLIAAFGSQSHDVIFAPTNLGAKMYQSNIGYQLLATIIWGNYYLVSTDVLEDVNDLTGRELVVFGQNQTSDIIIRHLMTAFDINVSYTYVDSVTTASTMFLMDTTQIVMVAEPLKSKLQTVVENLQVLDLQSLYRDLHHSGSYPQAGVFIKSTLSSNKIKQIEKDLQGSIQKVNQDPEDAAELALKLGMALPYEVIINAIPSSHLEYVSASDSKNELIIYFQLILDMNPNLIGGMLPDDSFYLEV